MAAQVLGIAENLSGRKRPVERTLFHEPIAPPRKTRTFASTYPSIPASNTGAFELNLTQFCYKTFVIRDPEIPVLNQNPILPDRVDSLFTQVPRWEIEANEEGRFVTRVRPRADSSVLLERGSYVSSGSYGAAFNASFTDRNRARFDNCIMKVIPCYNPKSKRQAMVEMCIHAIVSHTVMDDSVIQYRQSHLKMARTPLLLAAFVVNEKLFEWQEREPYIDSDKEEISWMVFVMEKVGSETMFHYVSRHRSDYDVVNTIVSFAIYQVASLLERLGELLSFNHRDTLTTNVMIMENTNPTSPKICSAGPIFQTCLIDFGMSRLTFRGRPFIGNSDLFSRSNPVQGFIEGSDIFYMLWSIRHSTGCNMNFRYECAHFYPVLDYVMQSAMNASGIDFENDLYHRPTQEMYEAISVAGQAEDIERIFHTRTLADGTTETIPVRSTRTPEPRLFSSKFIKQCMVYVLRICALKCPNSSGLTRSERNNLIRKHEASVARLIREQFDEVGFNDDEILTNAIVSEA